MRPYKILVKYPSRGRKERFFKSLDSCINNISDLDNFEISCTLDNDDMQMNNPEVISRIESYRNTKIEWGISTSKINAVNRNVPETDWDIIVVHSDDILYNVFGWDGLVRDEMEKHFPEGDGYLHFREKDSRDILNVMTVMDRKYYNRFGYIYHPSYLSLWCDNEQTEVARMLGRYAYIPYEIILHRNSAYGYPDCPRDEMFNRQQNDWGVDEKNFYERKAKNFDIHLNR